MRNSRLKEERDFPVVGRTKLSTWAVSQQARYPPAALPRLIVSLFIVEETCLVCVCSGHSTE